MNFMKLLNNIIFNVEYTKDNTNLCFSAANIFLENFVHQQPSLIDSAEQNAIENSIREHRAGEQAENLIDYYITEMIQLIV